MRTRSGFTMIEIVIVVVMLGILAAVALPKLVGPNEMVRSSEGQQILGTLMSAQKRQCLDNGSFVAAGAIANLDMAVASANFVFDTANPGAPCDTAAGVVATATSVAGGYVLSINTLGIITCANGAVTCATIKCNKGGGANQCNI